MDEKKGFDQVEITQLSDEATVMAPARMSWRDAGIADHFVQFYHADSFLIEAVGDFIGEGLRTVEGGIIIATKAHREALEDRLKAQGVDLHAAIARKQYVSLDAEETLARFMVNGMPDKELFTHAVSSVVMQMVPAGFRVRTFSEMVALLWAEGNTSAAIELEHLWNNLGETWRFALFCAYPMAHFKGNANDEGFRHICAAHAGFIPAEEAADGRGALPHERPMKNADFISAEEAADGLGAAGIPAG
jgi:hypothetical protein